MAASATVKGGFWPENGVGTLTLMGEDSYGRHRVAAQLGTKGMAVVRALLDALTGSAVGGTAQAIRTRVAASEELGGKRAIQAETLINRATTIPDKTEMQSTILTYSTRTHDPTPPINKDMNPLGTR